MLSQLTALMNSEMNLAETGPDLFKIIPKNLLQDKLRETTSDKLY